jgi:hypothetical protein
MTIWVIICVCITIILVAVTTVLLSSKSLYSSRLIPRVILQAVKDKNDIHPKIAESMNRLKDNNPGWEYNLMDHEDIAEFLSTHHPGRVENAWHSINPEYGAARSDLFRYVWMYDNGGAYFDDKSSADRPLDDIIQFDDEYILSHSGSKNWAEEIGNEYGEFHQWHIISTPRHPFLKAVINMVLDNIENYDPSRDGVGGDAVLRLTGPIAYTKAIIPLLEDNPHRIAIRYHKIGLVYTVPGHHAKLRTTTHYKLLETPIVIPLK